LVLSASPRRLRGTCPFANAIEELVRDILDCSLEHWKLVPASQKDELWDGLKKAFSFPPDSDNIVKEFCMETNGDKFPMLEVGTNTRYLKADCQPFKGFRDIRTEQ
jgi:hypothetical protein